MARPRVYSDEQIITALKAKRGLVFLAAKALGCSPDTIRSRAKQSPAVADCIAAQRGEVIDAAEEKLFAAVKRGQPWAVGLVLKTLGRDRGYVERAELRHGGDDGAAPIGHTVTVAHKTLRPEDMTTEELDFFLNMMERRGADAFAMPEVVAPPAPAAG